MQSTKGTWKGALLRLGRLKQEVRALEEQLHLVKSPELPSLSPAVQETMACLITDHSADLLSVHTPAGDYAYVSPNSEGFFGWTAADLLGRSAYELFHPADIERIAEDHARHMERSENPCVRYRLRNRDGEYRWMETRSRTTYDRQHIVCITRDINDQIQEEEARRIAERRLFDELHHRAHSDPLTGLANRRALEEALDHELERSGRRAEVVSVVTFDVDHFKSINDLYGHARGDEVLRVVANRLQAAKRSYDTVGRWAGDEFLLILPETSLEEARDVAERMKASVPRQVFLDIAPLTLSGGVASSTLATDREELLRLADVALYRAKRLGRDRVEDATSSSADSEYPEGPAAASPGPRRP